MSASYDVLVPSSREGAVEAFGDGRGVTIFAGGTILVPEVAVGRLHPERALLLGRAGLDRIETDGGTTRIGAMVTVAALQDAAPEPLATFAGYVGDYEVRAQATLGGNLCAPPETEAPRGDLQAALLALDARVRSAGLGGERTESIDDFLAGDRDRLVLEVEVDRPVRASAAGLGRPHAHHYTMLGVACAETAGGVRVAVAGAGPRGVRCPSVERAFADGAEPATAAAEAVSDLDPADDALASAWYRRKMLPVLVERALAEL